VSTAPVRVPRSAWAAAGAATGAGAAWLGADAVVPLSCGLVLVGLGWVVPRMSGRRWVAATASGVGMVLLGVRLLVGPAATPPATLPEGDGPWPARVESTSSPRDGGQVARLTLLPPRGGPVTVAATLPSFPTLRAGAVVEVSGRLQPPPDDDPYGEYLRRTGAAGSMRADHVLVLQEPDGGSVQALRDDAGDALRLALPEPEAGLAAGILIGLRERVDRALAADFATAGASHIVAISGWNIAIVAGLVGAVLRGRSRRLVAILVGGTITAYVVAAGGSPSVVRAALMAAVVLAARESGRAGRAPAALSLAALMLLLVDPAMIGDAGFRLSVTATAGLLAWASPVGAWLGRLHLPAGRAMPRWLAESLGISLAAQAATLPDVLLTFGRLSLVAPGVNLLVVPLVPAAMAAGVIAMAGGWLAMLGLPVPIATLAGLPAWLVLHVIVAVVRIAASLPFAAVIVPPQAALVAVVAIVLGLALLRTGRVRFPARVGRGMRTRRPPATPVTAEASRAHRATRSRPRPRWERPLAATCLVVVALSTLALGEAAGRATRLVMLDVGQGDAILVESSSGPRMLVDGGPDPDRLLLELDARLPPWDRRIDILVLTHPHEDHVAGLVRVLERYRVGRVFEPGMRGPGPGWEAWDRLLRARPIIHRATLSAGARLHVGEVAMAVMWPDPGAVSAAPGETGRAINDTSIVLLGEALGRRFLLTGDAEEDVDPALVARGLPHVDVLKVAHHGSATATSAALLAATRPTVALISVGAGNDYGHPAPSTLDRLHDAGARVLRTDQVGGVEVDLRRDGIAIRTSGARRTTAAGTPAITATRYDPRRDRPDAPRGRQPAALPRAVRAVPAARVRRRRRGRLAGEPDRSSWHRPRPDGRRMRGAAPRRGQAVVGGACGRGPPRRRLGGLAGRPRHALAGGDRP
jgi:competence protein ComEC